MGLAWLYDLLCRLQAYPYPQILLTVFCFFVVFVIRGLTQNRLVLINWPIVGMLPSLLANAHRLHDWTTEVLRKSGGTTYFRGPWFAGMEMVVTADPANIRYITSTARAGDFPRGRDHQEIFGILGDGILNADHDSWRVQRRWAHLLMRQMRFRLYVERTGREKVEKGLLPVLDHMAEEDRSVDLQDVMQRFTFDATCIFVCGIDPGCLSDSFPIVPFGKAVDDAEEVILFRHTVPKTWWKLLQWLRIGSEKTMTEALEIIDRCIAEFISSRRKDLDQAKENYKTEKKKEQEEVDLLTSYMEYEAEEEMEKMKSDKFLRDVILNMLVAGRDTTSTALTWFFWELSRNPEMEAKILDELRANLPQTDNEEENSSTPTKNKLRVFKADELGGLVYLHAALSECLRLHPPLPIIQKCATSEDTFPSGHKIRPGLKVYCTIYAMARMESIWGKDCNEFKPERWISEAGSLRTDYSDKFFTFHAGPRSCLGKDISFTQMKMVAAAVLYNFQVQVLKNQIIRPKTSIILYTENGLKVKIKKR